MNNCLVMMSNQIKSTGRQTITVKVFLHKQSKLKWKKENILHSLRALDAGAIFGLVDRDHH